MSDRRSLLSFEKGAIVWRGDQEYVIVAIADLKSLLARNLATGDIDTLEISSLNGPPPSQTKAKADVDLMGVSREDWDEAKRRLDVIKPLLTRRARGEARAVQLAKAAGVSVPTLYAWRRDYLGSGLLSSLLPYRSEGGKGKSRIKDPVVDEAMRQTIDKFYLTDAKPSVAKAMEDLTLRCQGLGVTPPSIHTLRRRIKWRVARDVVAAREGEYAARMMFDADEGRIQNAEWPLAMNQVDHTLLPVIIVDEEFRRAIARPWVTLAIDIDSRVVPGYYLSLDPPSSMSAGLCIAHAILPKDRQLAELGLSDVEWPCWGVMGSLHMDNAKEFRGKMLQAACDEYTIDLHLRPVKKPNYGGHIERLMGTVSEELKSIPGATFSGPGEKGKYDAEGNAIMTLRELERWFILFLAEYHHRIHSSLGMSPLRKYQIGLLGTKGKPGRGLPDRRLDEEKVRIDFMPYEERTVQSYGVMWDFCYFSDVLRPWVNATDPEHPSETRYFRFRRDPRDLSRIYFFDPLAKRYFAIPYRDLTLPPVSEWEYRAAKKALKQEGIDDASERQVADYVLRKREVVEQSASRTKAARRTQQKQKEHAKARARTKKELPKTSAAPAHDTPPSSIRGYDPSEVTPYDDDE